MHHNDTQEKSSGFWSLANILISLVLVTFTLSIGVAFIVQGWKHSRWHGEDRLVIKPEAASAGESAAPAAAPSSDAAAAPAAAAPAAGDAFTVLIKPGTDNPMSFDVKSFTVKAGQKVKLTFDNKSAAPLQHNLVLGAKGSKEKLITAANAMMSDMPAWLSRGFIPEGPDVIAHTKLLNPGETGVLEFDAPKEAGEYPYICTFPGHAAIMQGTMIVE